MYSLEAASVAGVVLVGVIGIHAGRGPVELAHVAILHARAAWRWAGEELIPALRTAAGRYGESVDAVRRSC